MLSISFKRKRTNLKSILATRIPTIQAPKGINVKDVNKRVQRPN